MPKYPNLAVGDSVIVYQPNLDRSADIEFHRVRNDVFAKATISEITKRLVIVSYGGREYAHEKFSLATGAARPPALSGRFEPFDAKKWEEIRRKSARWKDLVSIYSRAGEIMKHLGDNLVFDREDRLDNVALVKEKLEELAFLLKV